jgi:hypothetical protein
LSSTASASHNLHRGGGLLEDVILRDEVVVLHAEDIHLLWSA